MDLLRVIRRLRAKLAKVEKCIAALEALSTQRPLAPKRKRGRKSMGPEERREVAKRMRLYWAARKEGRAKEEQ
jgi:hypothetical protein